MLMNIWHYTDNSNKLKYFMFSKTKVAIKKYGTGYVLTREAERRKELVHGIWINNIFRHNTNEHSLTYKNRHTSCIHSFTQTRPRTTKHILHLEICKNKNKGQNNTLVLLPNMKTFKAQYLQDILQAEWSR